MGFFRISHLPQNPSNTPDACGDMARIAQNEADAALGVARGNARIAIDVFDRNFSEWYVGRPMRTASDIYNLYRDGPAGRTVPPYYFGQTGFKTEYKEVGANNQIVDPEDQTHHFVAMFSAGINRAWATATGHNATDNAGDQRLTNAAYRLGAQVRGDPRYWLPRVGDLIRREICDPNRNPRH